MGDITNIERQSAFTIDDPSVTSIEIKKAFINSSGESMEELNIETIRGINYDKVEDKSEENKKFINDTTDWKSIYDDKKY